MTAIPEQVRAKRRTVIDAALILIVILLITQMWLLTASLESFLAGHHEVALPGMLVSGALSGLCFALYGFVRRINRLPGSAEQPGNPGHPGIRS
jgi:hypothetical protein